MSTRPPAAPPVKVVAFTSPTSGAGRTSAVANLAWILASAGKRVLTLDWCTRTPRIHDFLRPFLIADEPSATVLGADLVELATPSGRDSAGGHPRPAGASDTTQQGRHYRYNIPGSTNTLEMVGLGNDDADYPLDDRQRAIDLRAALQRAPYDHVLIDSPSDTRTAAIQFLATLCDAVAICSTPQISAVRGAVDLAGQLCEQATVGIRVLALPQVDAAEPRRGHALDLLQEQYGPLLDRQPGALGERVEVNLIEMPIQHYRSYADVLAVIADDPTTAGLRAGAYARVSGWLTNQEITSAIPVPAGVRRRYLQSVLLSPPDATENILVSYVPRDRPWADWVRQQVQRCGAQVRLRAATGPLGALPAGTVPLSVLSTRYRELPDTWRIPVLGTDAVAPESLGLLVDGTDDPRFGPQDVIDLRGVGSVPARARLLSRFGLIAPPLSETEPGAALGYPGDPDRPTIFEVPERNPDFVGRDQYLERLRDHLLTEATPVTLAGGAGVGKSEIVRELAHRFAYDYDLVWWIAAEDDESVRASLTALGKRLGVAETANVTEATLKALSDPRRTTPRRWLLIYDNADQIDVDGLLPTAGAGHVVITSRDDGTHGLPAPIEVSIFHSDESVSMLREQVPDLSVADARAIARAVEHLPLALRLVVAWVRENTDILIRRGNSSSAALQRCVTELLARLDRAAPPQNTEPIPGSHLASVQRAMAIIVQTLAQEEYGPLAIKLAELTAFLAPEGVSLRLLRSTPMLVQLAAAAGIDPDGLLLDAVDIDQVLLCGARFALFEVGWGRDAQVRMHRAVQSLLKKQLADADAYELRHAQVLRGLAGYAPSDPSIDDDELGYIFEELRPHLSVSRAVDSLDPAVRHWVVKQVRYLYRLGDGATWRAALHSAEQARQRWTATGGYDLLAMRLCTQMANLHRGLGQYAEALALDEQMLDLQRRELGLRHFRTLVTGRGRGGDLRGLGRFTDALVEDQVTYAGFRAILGDDHPNTLMAVHNLALSFLLSGDAREALRLQREERDQRLRAFGPLDPRTWQAACAVGNFQRELGDYVESQRTLKEALNHIRSLRPPGHQDELQIIQGLATTERKLRLPTAKKRSQDAFNGYRELYGADHPFTRAAQLGVAVDYFWAADPTSALDLALPCLRGYEKRLGRSHPFTAVCAVDIALFRRELGDIDQAVADGSSGVDVLQESLGEVHPWTLAAQVNLAGHLAVAGDLALAEARQQQTLRLCLRVLGRRHPYTRSAQDNLNAIKIRAHGVEPDPPPLAGTDLDIPQT